MKRLALLTTLLLTLLSGLTLAEPHAARAQTGTIDLISQISGPVSTVFVQDNYTYISIGSHLLILDTTNLTKPTKISEITLLNVIQDIYVTGNYAYVAVEGSGLQIVNISNKILPILVSSYDTPGAAKSVYVMGNYAYIADNDKGLQIIDVKNPAIPSLTSNYDTPGAAQGVYVMGNYAYIADYNKGLQVINISNPTTPILVGNYAGGANKVYVMGNYAYVISTDLQIIDISNPTDPRLIGNYYTPGTAFDVYVIGNYAYVADWDNLQIINISNPTTPNRVGTIDTPGYAKDVYVVGNYAYVADSSKQLQIVDISNQTAPKLAGNYNMPQNVYGVYVTGNYAYLADQDKGLRIVDIINPSAPSLVGTYDNVNTVYGVHVVGNYAYLADSYYNGLQIIDISNPAIPKFVGSYNTPGDALGIYVAGSYAYVADGTKGLQIIDISTPTSPSFIGSYDTLGEAHSVSVTGNTAYVADGTKGLQIINISTPANPSRIGFFDTPGNARSVYVTGNTVYVADSGSGLLIIDISNPSAPNLVGSYDTGNAYGVYVTGNYAYVADNGLQVINISNPAAPTLRGSYDTPGNARGVAVSGNTAYVADEWGGLVILRFNEATPTPTNTPTVPTATQTATTVPPTSTPTVTTVPPTNTPTATTVPPTNTPTSTPTATTPPTPTNTPTSTPTATTPPTPTNTPTPTPDTAPPDPYEADNSCPEAKAITTDGLAQSHTFHVSGDEDWVKFEGTVSTTYLIDVSVPDSSTADVAMVMWDKCNGNATPNDSFNPEIHLQFKAPSNGTYFMHLTDNNDNGGAGVTYQLSVRTVAETASPGALVLVVGRLRVNDSLQTNIHNVTNNVYRLFTHQGYPPERITYLANDLTLNPDGDELTKDVDNLARRDNLQLAISQAADKVGPDRAFTLYMMDHGNEDKFYLNGSNQTVAPDELSSWLDALEAAAPGVKVNVIIDACYSGSFIKGAKRLGKPGRVIIASTTDQTSAYASPAQGAIFSDSFLQGLGQKWSLYDSFMEGQLVARKWHSEQIAMIDSNGNGLPNEAADFSEAQRRGFAYAGTFSDEGQPPYIALANGPTQIKNGQGELQAVVKDDVTVGKLAVWAVIYKPSYVPPASSEELVADIENLPTIKLNGPDSNQQYRGLYEGFNESGTYRIVIYAVDEDGLQSRPREVSVTVGGVKIYLPLIVK